MMQINIVVAASDNNVIGVNNTLPWSLRDDLRFFKRITMGKPIVMGKNTWLSLGKPLQGRLNVVLSTSLASVPEEALLFPDWDTARKYLEGEGHAEISIIGGGAVYASTLQEADVLYLTRVHTEIEAPSAVHFPVVRAEEWELVKEEYHPQDDQHIYAFTFQQWNRKR